MFTKRELYLLARAIFDFKVKLRSNKENNKIKLSPDEFDDYIELSILHNKIKDLINNDNI